jgi:transposase-like protein
VSRTPSSFVPPRCPNAECKFHLDPRTWRWKRIGFYLREQAPQRIQRFLCVHCRRAFSSQTFSTSYWLKRPELLPRVFMRVLSCSAYRQIAREVGASPTTIMRQCDRLGRHCLLFHERLRPKAAPRESLAIDGFESFEFSQYTPVHFHAAIGSRSHFIYGLTDSELRRKGRMTESQRHRRAALEASLGRPNPRSIEHEMGNLLEIVVPQGARATIHSDEHRAYPRAVARLGRLGRVIRHLTVSSRISRTPDNPLFPVNLADLLIRHSQANHKRETIAFSKRRACAAYRMFVFVVWRNTMKSFSERKRDESPAQRLGLLPRRLGVEEVLRVRLFPSCVGLPPRWVEYYRRSIETRRIPNGVSHSLRYAA